MEAAQLALGTERDGVLGTDFPFDLGEGLGRLLVFLEEENAFAGGGGEFF
jgi:hypothetical protein